MKKILSDHQIKEKRFSILLFQVFFETETFLFLLKFIFYDADLETDLFFSLPFSN